MTCPECHAEPGWHEEWCSIGRDIRLNEGSDELNDSVGCSAILLLCAGYIVTLSAIGICLIIIRLELAL